MSDGRVMSDCSSRCFVEMKLVDDLTAESFAKASPAELRAFGEGLTPEARARLLLEPPKRAGEL